VSQSVLSFSIDKDYEKITGVSFASQYVSNKFNELILKGKEEERKAFMSVIQDTPIARSMLGTMFETEGHEFLARGGEFNVSRLISREQSGPRIVERFPKLNITHWNHYKPEDVKGFNESYIKPMSKGFASVDSFYYDLSTHKVRLFQFTVSSVHGYKASGLRLVVDIMKKIDKDCIFELYLVVPPFVYDSVVLQTISNTTKKEITDETKTEENVIDQDILSIPQFKLEFPFDSEDLMTQMKKKLLQ